MTLIKLSENHYVDADDLSDVRFRSDLPEPVLEILYKSSPSMTRIAGHEAEQAWENIKNAIDGGGRPAHGD